jgi:hypothetical protein
MSNKITGKDLERLINEAMMLEGFPKDPTALVVNKGKQSHHKGRNPYWLKNHPKEAWKYSNIDKDPSNFSGKDFEAALGDKNSDFVSDLLNYYFELYLDDDENAQEFYDALENYGKTKSAAKAAAVQYGRVPFQKGQTPWKSTYHGGPGPGKILNQVLKRVDPKNKIKSKDWERLATMSRDGNDKLNYKDFEELMRRPSDPLHFPMVTFVDRAYVLADKEIIDGLVTFKRLIKIADEAKVDPEDLGLGRDKSIPQFDVQTRYAEKTGQSTPETLQRIFDNAFSKQLSTINNLQERIGEIASLTIKGPNESIEKIMSKTIAYDYLRRIIMDYESSPAGFLFENFLALLVSGTKEGGNMRIEDFSFRTGAKKATIKAGSAKLYGPDANKFGGSCKLLVSTLGRSSYRNNSVATVHYFLARKGEDLKDITITTIRVSITHMGTYKTPAKKAARIPNIPNNSPYWLVLDEIGNNGHIFMKKTKTGKEKFYFAEGSGDDDTQWELPWPSTVIGSIAFPSLRLDQEGYNEELKGYMDTTKEKLGEMFRALNNFQVDSTKYFSILQDKDQRASSEKINSFDVALESLKSLRSAAFTSFDESGKNYKGIAKGTSKAAKAKQADIAQATTGALQESKSDSVSIKKLIEESFKR